MNTRHHPALSSKAHWRLLWIWLLSFAVGCGGGASGGGGVGGITSARKSGTAHGGQGPICGSRVHLRAAGQDRFYGERAAELASVTTDNKGAFVFSSFSCPSPDVQTYYVATGGSATGCSDNNRGITMMAALGRCDSIPDFVNINELTRSPRCGQ